MKSVSECLFVLLDIKPSLFYAGIRRRDPEDGRGFTRERQALRLPALQRQRGGQEHEQAVQVSQMRRGEVLLP